jgi:large subunit ribosomal protein L33
MAKAGNRIIFSLECQTCKRRNYSTTKNKRTNPEKVKANKYCAFCRRHTEHKETK